MNMNELFKEIKKANAEMALIEIVEVNPDGSSKKSLYPTVKERVLAFRKVYPKGRIETELANISPNFCSFIAKCYDDKGNYLASGHAFEFFPKEGENRSTLESCETSAVGRCLSFAGFTGGTTVASYEEVRTTIDRTSYKKMLEDYCSSKGLQMLGVCKQYKLNGSSSDKEYEEVLKKIGVI